MFYFYLTALTMLLTNLGTNLFEMGLLDAVEYRFCGGEGGLLFKWSWNDQQWQAKEGSALVRRFEESRNWSSGSLFRY